MNIAVVCSGIQEESVREEFGDKTVIIPSNESGAAILASPRSSTGRAKAQEILRETIRLIQTLTESEKELESVRVLLEIDDCYSVDDARKLFSDAEHYLSEQLRVYEDDGVYCSYEHWMFSHSRKKWQRLEL